MMPTVLTMVLLHSLVTTEVEPPDVAYQRGLDTQHDRRVAQVAFAAAARGFDARWTTDSASRTPELALLRGRSHFLAGQIPQALRAWHEGLRRAPSDRELLADLAFARSTIRYPEAVLTENRVRPDDLDAWRNRVSPRDGFLAGFFFGLLAVVGIAKRLTSRPAWSMPVAIIGITGFGLSAILAWQIQQPDPHDRAILARETILRTGNGTTYPAQLPEALPPGTEVEPLAERGGWLQVRLPGGAIGWLPGAVLLRIS